MGVELGMDGVAPDHRTRSALAAGAASMAVLAHFLPSVCVLGQWSPIPLRSLPRGWCRWRGPAGSKAVALTFDDGPDPDSTPKMLDLLDELSMKASFFVLGEQARRHRDIVEEIRRRGHVVGSHGHRHEHHLLRTPGWIKRDIRASVEAIQESGQRPTWYRPPYGQLTARTIVEARRAGMEVVLWSAWGHEWSESLPPPVMARLQRGIEPGAILLLHDSDRGAPHSSAALAREVLPLVAEELRAHDLRAVTLDELCRSGA